MQSVNATIFRSEDLYPLEERKSMRERETKRARMRERERARASWELDLWSSSWLSSSNYPDTLIASSGEACREGYKRSTVRLVSKRYKKENEGIGYDEEEEGE